MSSTEKTYDRSDLILTWFQMRKYRTAHDDIRDFHSRAYVAFSKAFGIDLDVPPTNSPILDEDGLYGLFLSITSAYERVRSPFAAYMCGTKQISELYQKYKGAIERTESSMRKLHMKMLLDLVERIWGGEAPHQVSEEELNVSGHPRGSAPDPADYW